MILTAVLLCLLLLSVCLCLHIWMRNRKMYRVIDQMMDEILDGEEISQSDIKEGGISVLAAKAKRIQEKVNLGIQSAEEEKEQVKSLISNMSHQLKTPLAGVMMYREMMEDDSLDAATRKKFLSRMKQQSEKIDLAENRNHVLSKEQILTHVWDSQGKFVDENTLSVNIRRIRSKLEEDPKHPVRIRTVHGIGYVWKEGDL